MYGCHEARAGPIHRIYTNIIVWSMMKRLLLIFMLILLSAPHAMAQKKVTMNKRLKEARAAVKSNSGQENIERILLDSIALPTTTDEIKAEAYHLCALLEQSMNDGLNMNAYLKQNIDTVRLYRTILNIYDYTLKSDSIDERGKFGSKNRKLRALHRKNLLGGGKFHLRASKWADAYPFFDTFLRTSTMDMDSVVGRVAYWATICGMNENNPHHVLEHVDKAIELTSDVERPALSEYKARSCVSLGDSAQWVGILEKGVDSYPGYNYFFLNLMDYYMRHGQTDHGLQLTDSLIRNDGDRAVYWFAMSMFALNREEYERCIEMSDECLRREPDNVDALYNKGISLLNMALKERNRARFMALYRRALEPMERVRELSPDDVSRWANPLYRIYLNLNMGEKFEEIDTLLMKHYDAQKEADQKAGNDVPDKGVETETPRLDKHLR